MFERPNLAIKNGRHVSGFFAGEVVGGWKVRTIYWHFFSWFYDQFRGAPTERCDSGARRCESEMNWDGRKNLNKCHGNEVTLVVAC